MSQVFGFRGGEQGVVSAQWYADRESFAGVARLYELYVSKAGVIPVGLGAFIAGGGVSAGSVGVCTEVGVVTGSKLQRGQLGFTSVDSAVSCSDVAGVGLVGDGVSVSVVGDEQHRVRSEPVGVCVDNLCGSGDAADVSVSGPVVSERTLANRRKRQRKVAAKERKRSGGVGASVKSSVVEELKSSSVPEWRRQDVRAKYHRGAFADCSADVQRELRESRAKMLVEKNKAAVVEAEHKRRTMEARLKTRIVEAEAEKKRLTLAAENKKLVEARLAALPRGYAETVVSMGLESVADVPSLSSGSVSPDSSISVAELDRMKAAMEKLITRVAELEVQAEDHANEKEAAKKQKQQRPVVRGMFEPTDYERERALYSRWD